jgi:hypothetical protein
LCERPSFAQQRHAPPWLGSANIEDRFWGSGSLSRPRQSPLTPNELPCSRVRYYVMPWRPEADNLS